MFTPALLGSILLALVGLLLWRNAVAALSLRAAMKRWPVEEGVVLKHRTERAMRAVRVDTLVSFRHAGQDHTVWCGSPTRAAYGPGSGDQGVRFEMKRFPVGATVPVHVNPGRPEEAYLELPEQHMIVPALGFGALALVWSATVGLTASGRLTEEVASLVFFLTLGGVLSVAAISMSVALCRAYFLTRRR